jgi:hypothetical protein
VLDADNGNGCHGVEVYQGTVRADFGVPQVCRRFCGGIHKTGLYRRSRVFKGTRLTAAIARHAVLNTTWTIAYRQKAHGVRILTDDTFRTQDTLYEQDSRLAIPCSAAGAREKWTCRSKDLVCVLVKGTRDKTVGITGPSKPLLAQSPIMSIGCASCGPFGMISLVN